MKKFYALSLFIGLLVGFGVMFGPSIMTGGLFSPPKLWIAILSWFASLGIALFAVYILKPNLFHHKSKVILLIFFNVLGFFLSALVLIWGIIQAFQNWRLTM